jgi:hypothetical protein
LQMCCFVRCLFILSFLFFCHYVANCLLSRFFTLGGNGQVYEQWWDFPHLLLFLLRL